MEKRRAKTLIVGVDGFDSDYFSNLIQSGNLPILERLANNGLHRCLKSTVPPSTCPAWVSSVTGVNVGKHGIYDFLLAVEPSRRAMTFANSMERRTNAIWNVTSQLGMRSIILNVPVTFPPEKIDGVMVSGMLTPGLDSDFTYPKALKHELIDMGYQIDIGDTMIEKLALQQRNEIGLLASLRELIRTRTLAAEYLMKEFEWDLFMVVYTALDRLYHLFWRYIDPRQVAYDPTAAKAIYPHISSIHRELDRAIGRLLKAAGKDANLLVYSDHGFRPLNRFLLTNSILKQKGLLGLRRSTCASRLVSQESMLRLSLKFHLEVFLDRLPAHAKRRIGRLIRPSSEFAFVTELDPNETKAFHFGYNYIRINENSTTEMERVQIEKDILDLFNHKLFGLQIKAHKRESLFHGPMVKKIPQIILDSQGDVTSRPLIPINCRTLMVYDSGIKVPSLMWNGDHGSRGVIVASGPKVRYNQRLHANRTAEANIVDVAPTILEMLGAPVSPLSLRMDGRSIIGKKEAVAHSI